MFKKILLPTDGSPLSVHAAYAGIAFAKSIGAEVLVACVTQPFASIAGFDGVMPTYTLADEGFGKAMAEQAQKFVEHVAEKARAEGVGASTLTVSEFNVADAIAQIADEQGCDLIFMGSHGRSGLSRLLLGSVASKVVSLAHVGVLVHREPAAAATAD